MKAELLALINSLDVEDKVIVDGNIIPMTVALAKVKVEEMSEEDVRDSFWFIQTKAACTRRERLSAARWE